ncbi:3991_t:CDS:1, partial [Racocetra persica]
QPNIQNRQNIEEKKMVYNGAPEVAEIGFMNKNKKGQVAIFEQDETSEAPNIMEPEVIKIVKSDVIEIIELVIINMEPDVIEITDD